MEEGLDSKPNPGPGSVSSSGMTSLAGKLAHPIPFKQNKAAAPEAKQGSAGAEPAKSHSEPAKVQLEPNVAEPEKEVRSSADKSSPTASPKAAPLSRIEEEHEERQERDTKTQPSAGASKAADAEDTKASSKGGDRPSSQIGIKSKEKSNTEVEIDDSKSKELQKSPSKSKGGAKPKTVPGGAQQIPSNAKPAAGTFRPKGGNLSQHQPTTATKAKISKKKEEGKTPMEASSAKRGGKAPASSPKTDSKQPKAQKAGSEAESPEKDDARLTQPSAKSGTVKPPSSADGTTPPKVPPQPVTAAERETTSAFSPEACVKPTKRVPVQPQIKVGGAESAPSSEQRPPKPAIAEAPGAVQMLSPPAKGGALPAPVGLIQPPSKSVYGQGGSSPHHEEAERHFKAAAEISLQAEEASEAAKRSLEELGRSRQTLADAALTQHQSMLQRMAEARERMHEALARAEAAREAAKAEAAQQELKLKKEAQLAAEKHEAAIKRHRSEAEAVLRNLDAKQTKMQEQLQAIAEQMAAHESARNEVASGPGSGVQLDQPEAPKGAAVPEMTPNSTDAAYLLAKQLVSLKAALAQLISARGDSHGPVDVHDAAAERSIRQRMRLVAQGLEGSGGQAPESPPSLPMFMSPPRETGTDLALQRYESRLEAQEVELKRMRDAMEAMTKTTRLGSPGKLSVSDGGSTPTYTGSISRADGHGRPQGRRPSMYDDPLGQFLPVEQDLALRSPVHGPPPAGTLEALNISRKMSLSMSVAELQRLHSLVGDKTPKFVTPKEKSALLNAPVMPPASHAPLGKAMMSHTQQASQERDGRLPTQGSTAQQRILAMRPATPPPGLKLDSEPSKQQCLSVLAMVQQGTVKRQAERLLKGTGRPLHPVEKHSLRLLQEIAGQLDAANKRRSLIRGSAALAHELALAGKRAPGHELLSSLPDLHSDTAAILSTLTKVQDAVEEVFADHIRASMGVDDEQLQAEVDLHGLLMNTVHAMTVHTQRMSRRAPTSAHKPASRPTSRSSSPGRGGSPQAFLPSTAPPSIAAPSPLKAGSLTWDRAGAEDAVERKALEEEILALSGEV